MFVMLRLTLDISGISLIHPLINIYQNLLSNSFSTIRNCCHFLSDYKLLIVGWDTK